MKETKETVLSYLLATIVSYLPKQIILNHILRFVTMCKLWYSLISDPKLVNYDLCRYTCYPLFKLTIFSRSLKTECTDFWKLSLTTLSCHPDEIISEIFTRVPANQLTPMKGVCKRWNSLISHPDFVNLQLVRSRLSQQQILILNNRTPDEKLLFINMQDKDVRLEYLYLNFPFSRKFRVKASCDGLLLLLDQNKELYVNRELYVYNPATTKYLRLPDLENMGSYWTLFYDNDMEKYRVFGTLLQNRCEHILLTVGDDSWRWLASPDALALTQAIFVKNELHWAIMKYYKCNEGEDWCVRSMDIAKLEFRDITAPMLRDAVVSLLSEVRGFLCLTTISRPGLELDIFVLESSSHGRWTKKYSVNIQSLANLPVFVTSFIDVDIVLVAVRDDDSCDLSGLVKILINDGVRLVYYDMKCQESKEIGPLSKRQFRLDFHHSCLFYSSSLVEV